jgi:RNA polymerase sigma-70 factor (ECF subfamily)
MAPPLDGPSRCDPQHLLTHLGWLRSLARQLVSDQQVAEDLAQDACIIALEGRPSDPARMRGWLTGTLERLVFKHLRSERRRLEHESEAAQRETLEETESLVEQVEAQGELVRLVLTLDEPYRDVILYYHFEDLSWSEIGHRLGVSTAAVKCRLQRAHAQLRKRLERSLGKDPRVWSLLLLGSPFDAGALLSNSGGLVMGTKLAVAGTVLATATLLTYLALGPSSGEARGPGALAKIEEGRGSPREPRTEQPQQPDASDARAPVAVDPEPAQAAVAEQPQQPVPAGLRARDRWLVALEGALEGDVDLAGFVDLGLEIAELSADASVLPQPQLGGAVAYPLLGAPQGVSAEFEVARTQNLQYQEPLLSLRLTIEPPTGAPYLVSGSARMQPEVHLAVFADVSGKPLSLAITADFPIDAQANRALGAGPLGRTPLSIHFSYDVADPVNSKAQLSWIEGDTTQRGPIDWRFVGKPLPSLQSLQDLLARLQAQHQALYK